MRDQLKSMTKEEFEQYVDSPEFEKFCEEMKKTIEEMEDGFQEPRYAPWSSYDKRYR